MFPPKTYTKAAIEMQMNPYREVVQSVAQVISKVVDNLIMKNFCL